MAKGKTHQLEQTPAAHKAATPEQSESSLTTRRVQWLSAAVALLLVLAVYGLRLDRIVGLIVDDAWYVMLAQALATGQGYTLINSPYPDLAPVYPPLHPFLLSLVYRVQANFPQNILALKSVACLAMLGVGALSLYWLRKHCAWPFWLALLGALVVTLTPGLVFLATSTAMSECLFMLTLLAGVVVFERATSEPDTRHQQLYLLAAAALAAAAFLTRSVGVALAVAAILYLLKARRWQQAVLYGVVFAVLCAPWLGYARAHRPTAEQQQLQGGMIMSGYLQNFWQRRAGLAESGEIELGDLPGRVWKNTLTLVGQDYAMMFAPLLHRSASISGLEVLESGGSAKLLAFLLAALILLGFILRLRQGPGLLEWFMLAYLALTLAWPWATFRFMLPLALFWLYYLVTGVLGMLDYQPNFSPVWRWRVPGIVLGCFLVLSLIDHGWYLKTRNAQTAVETIPWPVVYSEHQAALEWIKQRVPEDAVVASGNPALVYLYTGRKSVWFEFPEKNWDGWKKLNVRYIAHLKPQPVSEPSWLEGRFDMAYRSTGQLKLRVTNLGPPDKRAPWSLFNAPGTIKIDVNQ